MEETRLELEKSLLPCTKPTSSSSLHSLSLSLSLSVARVFLGANQGAS